MARTARSHAFIVVFFVAVLISNACCARVSRFRAASAPKERWHRPPGTNLSCTEKLVCDEIVVDDFSQQSLHQIGPFVYFKSELPKGESGIWKVEKVIQQHPNSKYAGAHFPFHYTGGVYTRLRDTSSDPDKGVFMSDYFFEWYTHLRFMEKACMEGGRTLITGLGMGYIVEALHLIPGCRVDHITVVEQSSDVINLVMPYLRGKYGGEDHLRIVQANAFTYRGVFEKPRPGMWSKGGKLWDTCWHDIWQNPQSRSVSNDVIRLENHYMKVCDWQGHWALDWQAAKDMAYAPKRQKHEL